MKAFFIGFLGVVLGILFLVFLLYIWVRSILNKHGFNGRSLLSLYQASKDEQMRSKQRHKQVFGMTNVLLPLILEDFPDFQPEQFFTKTEETIRTVLEAIESKNIHGLLKDDYILLREKIGLQIADLIETKVEKRYDDIIFHKHAIKSYKNEKGMIKLVLSSSLEYYYEEKRDGKVLVSDQYKKQTRYTTSFVYIYDTKKAGFDVEVLGLTCPNCGGPISDLKKISCLYCGSGIHLKVANLVKCWKVVELKEDY